MPNSEFNRRARVSFSGRRLWQCEQRRRSALYSATRHPAPNQVPLHAGQHHLTIVQRQAEWIEGRKRVGAAATGNLVSLLRSIGAAQFDRHPPFHPARPRSSMRRR